MEKLQTADSEHEERLAEALAAYLEAVEAGEPADPQPWLARYPDLAGELAAFIANERRLQGLAAPLRWVVQLGREAVPPDPASATVPQAAGGPGWSAPAGRVLGDYELLEEIARGGMGVVYRARQISLNRQVALKMVLSGPFASADLRSRFHTEAEAAARLDHPNIVPIHQVGEHEGHPYLCLKLIEGGSLAQKLKGTPLPAAEAVRLVEPLARAIHYAHQQGIIHRDLKPGNILLAEGETPHSWVPKITDFGLAKQLDSGVGLTQTGQILGTPSYMAPEQTGGRTQEIGPATDVYALGAILYETLTGRPPFQAATAFETLELLRTEDPAPPRLLNPKIDKDLQSICLKCLEKDPRNRYASAAALADDLRRYREGEAISVRSYNVLVRISRALDKRSPTEDEFRTLSTMLFLFAVIVLAGHLGTFLVLQAQLPSGLSLLSRACEIALGGLVVWRYRRRSQVPIRWTERQLWSIWIGYLVSYGVSVLTLHLLAGLNLITAGPAMPPGWIDLLMYPFSAVLGGLAFMVMGGLYWGRYYAVGILFFVLALLIALHLAWAPLAFGLFWAVVLTGIGLHLRHVASRAAGGGHGEEHFRDGPGAS